MNTKTTLKIATALAVACSALLAGCSPRYETPEIHDVKYRNHQYIVFRVEGNYGQTYVHDPDCECHKAR